MTEVYLEARHIKGQQSSAPVCTHIYATVRAKMQETAGSNMKLLRSRACKVLEFVHIPREKHDKAAKAKLRNQLCHEPLPKACQVTLDCFVLSAWHVLSVSVCVQCDFSRNHCVAGCCWQVHARLCHVWDLQL